MNQIQVQLLNLFSNVLFKSNKPLSLINPNALLTEASAQAVLPLVAPYIRYPNTQDTGKTAKTQDKGRIAKTQLNAILAKNLNVIYEHTELHDLLILITN